MSITPKTTAVCEADFESWEDKATDLANLCEKLEGENAALRATLDRKELAYVDEVAKNAALRAELALQRIAYDAAIHGCEKLVVMSADLARLTRIVGWLENSAPLALWRGGDHGMNIVQVYRAGYEDVYGALLGSSRDLCSAVEDAIALERKP